MTACDCRASQCPGVRVAADAHDDDCAVHTAVTAPDRRYTREDVDTDLQVAFDDIRDLLAHDPEVLVRYAEDISDAVEGLEAVLAKVGPPPKEKTR